MATVPIEEAKEQLETLFARAESGEDITISNGLDHGIRLVPVDKATLRGADRFRGVFTVPDTFFDPLPDDELARWYGEEPLSAEGRRPDRFRGVFTVPDSFFDPMTEEELNEWGW